MLSRCLFSHSKVNSPKIQNRTKQNKQKNYLQSSCHILTSSSGLQFQFLKIWSPWLQLLKVICFNNCRTLYSKTFSTSNPGHLVFCHRISSFEFQLFFSSFLWRKASYHHSLKILLRYIQINYKRAKDQHSFLQKKKKKVIFSGSESFVSAL